MTRPTRAPRPVLAAVFTLAATFAAASFTAAAVQVDDTVLIAKAVVQWISQGNAARAAAEFNDEARSRLPQEKLSEVWRSLIQQLGDYEGVEGVRVDAASAPPQVIVICRFERSAIHAKLAFDQAHKVSGLWFAPAESESENPGLLQMNPQPAAGASQPAARSIYETEVRVGRGDWELPGTLTFPPNPGPFAAVVLVHGSGPHDRDETVGPNKPFRDLALGLASRGVAVLRYEKRTKEHAQRMADLKDTLTLKEETIDDAIAALDLLRRTDGVDANRLFVLGHSLGGMAVPRMAIADGRLAGGIILAGTTRPLSDVIVDQMRYLALLDGTITPQEQIQLDQLQLHAGHAANPQAAADASALPPFGVPLSYWFDLQAYRPVDVASTLAIPLLILQGERDYQVTMTDFAGWKQGLSGNPRVHFKTYPGLNHLFIAGTEKSTPVEYEQPGHMAPEVIADIAQWIAQQ